MTGPAFDPVVRLADPLEPFSWTWEGRLSTFLADNADGIDATEAAAIAAVLRTGGTYSGGGGAEPEWDLWAMREDDPA